MLLFTAVFRIQNDFLWPPALFFKIMDPYPAPDPSFLNLKIIFVKTGLKIYIGTGT